MFSASLVTVAVLLSAHGDEPLTREEKFRGALVQAPAATSTPAPERELKALIASRPSLTMPTGVLGIGIFFTVGGAVLFALPVFIRSFAFALGEAMVWYAVFAGALAGIGIIVGVMAGIVMAMAGAEQTRIDERIHRLEMQLALQPRTAAVQFSQPPHLVLARF